MTSLNTERRGDGVHLTDNHGALIHIITYQSDDNGLWQVTQPDGEQIGKCWRSLEAAEFYALAVYADKLREDRMK